MPTRQSLLVLLAVFFFTAWLTVRTPSSSNDIHPERAPFVEDHSLTVVLPVVPSTLVSLDKLLAPFLVPTSILYEIAIVCPDSLATDIRHSLHVILSDAEPSHPKVSLYPRSGPMHHRQASLDIITQVKTQYILLLDERGFEEISECDRAYLVRPHAIYLPIGPRGFAGSSHNSFQLLPSDHAQPAAFLVPPFIAPAGLLSRVHLTSHTFVDWPSLGNQIAKLTLTPFGGIVVGTDIPGIATCNPRTHSALPVDESGNDPNHDTSPGPTPMHKFPGGFFILAFPHREDLKNFIPATRRLRQQGYTVWAYIYDSEPFDVVMESNCSIPCFERSKESPSFFEWLGSLGLVPDIVIGLDHQDPISSTIPQILERSPFLNTTLLRIPRVELPYTEWIGTLTLNELRHWNVPEVTLSVVTNNRPDSLQRLLGSIQRTLFYGDKVNVRINMDQTSDPETLHLVQDFAWLHGDVFLHHRVVQGGLLPAVVESWYPHCNDSYGLLLEDDIELSPLSYAWVKMTLLRYKYGDSSSSSSTLFGISLYQQKIIELRHTGRQPFNARTLFESVSLANPSTPYLSQIPCSWGALYFPIPWREFHDYLSLRLSQIALPIHSVIVPGVRSNRWTKSWKKYFIELVYLRGYVMLYPNYGGFVSLSTNHLEVGSHVRNEPEEVYGRKKDLFMLPLMQLSGALEGDAVSGPRLLDLPGGMLPGWEELPVLDLVGELSSMEAIQRRGERRRSRLDSCSSVQAHPWSVRDLFCYIPS